MSLNNRPKSPTLLLERYEINVHILDRTVAGNIDMILNISVAPKKKVVRPIFFVGGGYLPYFY